MSLDYLAIVLSKFGLPLVAAVAISKLVKESRPMSLTELSRATGYAKSHLSIALRLLEEKRMVTRMKSKGRRVLFVASRNAVLKLVREYIMELKNEITYLSSEFSSQPLGKKLMRFEEELERLLEILE
ncbi:MAG: hypothetical protein DRJ64_09060 [Thermoprotei archaeon]|nr:MAG: hypothetical protein DRJ64_09060 [Thermoprotei archaeon]